MRSTGITTMAIRTSRVAHLEENIAGASIELSDEDFAALSAIS